MPSYYLLTSAGDIDGFGGAGYYGSKTGAHLSGVVAGAATHDGGGYWFTTKKGAVDNYGDALQFGSLVHTRLRHPIAAMAATADSGGYWLVDASGAVYNFGDAPYCGSALHGRGGRPLTGIVPTADGQGYWLLSASGDIVALGDAKSYGSVVVHSKKIAVIAMARTPDGLGYWTVTSRGAIHNFGDAGFYGSVVHRHLSAPVVSITSSPDGHGYLLATANGRVYNFGDAGFDGSLAHRPPTPPTRVVALIPTISVPSASVVPLPGGINGVDIANYQCAKPGSTSVQANLPASALTIIEAAGWLDSANNSCLAAESAWANRVEGRSGAVYELYLFINAPGTEQSATALYSSGPKGTCGTESAATKQLCIAYNYGYNGARSSYDYASHSGVNSRVWWLDVENTSLSATEFSNFSANKFWSYSTTLNAATLQGAIDALRGDGAVVGIYSSSVQYPQIVGNYVPLGQRVPIWIAGAPPTKPPYTEANLPAPSILSAWCAGTANYPSSPHTTNDLFADGVPWILQETPGTLQSPDGIDPDYTC